MAYYWTIAPYAVVTAAEMCDGQAFGISVNLYNAGMTYASSFRSAQTIVGVSGCVQFGTAVWAIGSQVAQPNKTFVNQAPGVASRGAACVRANFFGAFSACSFHLAAGNVQFAQLQVGELVGHGNTLDPSRVLGGDANLKPTDRFPSTAPYAMSQMTVAGYAEGDAACPGFASCSSKQTFSIRCGSSGYPASCEQAKIDYVFTKGYSLMPRAFIDARPQETDHSQYIIYRQ